MSFTVTPHVNFRGEARAALDFYRQVFGGDQMLVTYADMGQEVAPDLAGQVMWGQIESADGVRIMAFDVLPDRPHDPGVNAFFVALRGTSEHEVTARWRALADGAEILRPLGPSAWTPLYGMLTDRFGVTWIVDLRTAG